MTLIRDTEWAADAWKQPGRAALLTAEVRGRGEHVAVVELDAPMLAELTESLNGPYVTVPATAVDDATLAVALAALDAAAGAGQELALPRALDAARASLQEAGSAR